MTDPEQVGRDTVSGRSLFVIEAAHPDDIPAAITVGGQFVCLLAWDAASASAAEVSAVATRLLSAGCVYICTWGADCSRVHDIFDEVDVARSPEGPPVMSTWHDDETLDDAIWFFLSTADPDPSFADGCRSAVAISIGVASWAAAIREALEDPGGFKARTANEA